MRGVSRGRFGARRHGPRLPGTLLSELGTDTYTYNRDVRGAIRRQSGGRSDARTDTGRDPFQAARRPKQIRQWKDGDRPLKRQRGRGGRDVPSGRGARGRGGDTRSRLAVQSSKTKFFELLDQDWEKKPTKEAFEKELALQLGLEKKLGLKKKGKTKTKTGPDDGLDDLLGDEGAVDEPAGGGKIINSSSERLANSRGPGSDSSLDSGSDDSLDDLMGTDSDDSASDRDDEDGAGWEEDSDLGSEEEQEGGNLEDESDFEMGDEDGPDSGPHKGGGAGAKKRGVNGRMAGRHTGEGVGKADQKLFHSDNDNDDFGEDEGDIGDSDVLASGSDEGDSDLLGESEEEEGKEEDEDGGEEQEEGLGSAHKSETAARSRRVNIGNSELEHGSKDMSEEEEDKVETAGTTVGKKSDAKAGSGAYVPPALRAAAGGNGSAQLERRVRGLLNRLSEANMVGIVRDVVGLYQEYGRGTVSDLLAAILLEAVAEGPRASRQFAAVSATFVAGVAAQTGAQEIGAGFLAKVALRLEEASKQQDSLAQSNLAMVLAYLYSCGLVKADLVYSLLEHLTERFQESDVSLMVTVLGACGPQLRASMPDAMKSFVLAVHKRAGLASKAGGLSKRSELLLELVVDIKNNRKARAQASGAAAVLSPPILKWLKSVGVADVALTGLTWPKLLKPEKKGMWWLPAAGEALTGGTNPFEAAGDVATTDASLAGSESLLALAAAQRMNTELRRALFCTIMGSEDVLEAFERLTSMRIKGEQQREVVRVLVHCSLQERTWNPYYALLASKLATASKAHRTTLQFTLWDQWKKLAELDARQLSHLARLAAHLVAQGSLSLTVLKVVDFGEAFKGKQLFFWRVFFQHLLLGYKDMDILKENFQRLAGQQQLAAFLSGLLIFLRASFGPWALDLSQASVLKLEPEQLDTLLKRLKIAEKSLKASGLI